MPIMAVTVRPAADAAMGAVGAEREDRLIYLDAPDRARAAASLQARGLVVVDIQAVERAPEGASVQRVHGPATGSAMPLGLRRLVFVAVGVGLGLVVILGTLFVLRAREHLTRSDVRPKVLNGR